MGVLRRKFIKSMPLGDKLWLALRVVKTIFALPKDVGFFGWDMFTPHSPPWVGDSLVSVNFNKANSDLLDLVSSRKFKLKLLTYSTVGAKSASDISRDDDATYTINNLRWRHYNIFWSVRHAINATSAGHKNFIECGVADGVSTYFAIRAAIFESCNQSKFFLYDSWEDIREEGLTSAEKSLGLLGEYSYLDINDTKSNLAEYKDMTVFNQGFLPDSLEKSENPTDSVWIHIDLNAAKPTLAALQYFYEGLRPGGVIIFDDYAWNGHWDTKKTVDDFFNSTNGTNLSLPTGQAIYFKHS